MADSPRRALIIGCGISGPVLAMFLHRAGFRPVVYERRSESVSGGGGSFNLAPNGLDVLRTLGLADEVLTVAHPTERIAFHNHKGRQLGINPEHTILVDRGELQRILVDAARRTGVPLEFGRNLTAVEDPGSGPVTARFDDGSRAEGDLLIGCDGLRSQVRRAVAPDAPEPSYTGIIDCGGYSDLPGRLPADGVMRMTFGLRGFFGYQPLPGGKVFWFQNSAAPDDAAVRSLTPDQWRDRLLAVHRDDHAPIPDILAASDEVDRFAVYEAPPVPAWSRGRLVLVGDAAHAMAPHTGQGASMALEDAVTLARCLRDNTSIADACAAYQADRKPRVDHVIRQTRQTGAQKTPGPVARAMRDLILPLFLKKAVGQTTALYDHHIAF
ncbi:FAD-dependent oxidoreductase [Actinophytocola sp.]|uniref:FAD-dependent oxidoreductase n=1 Tax=Actinophytocola sp. TaxID=1872138 RepID=UPI002D7F839F|nr:FAD-dependent monooxygenase [Actinophytocola sp.]HET9141283.1 FAD-dependent monooxygenase [Actinophytocola sp.]